MYHSHFRGTHYEAGFKWGSLLLKNKNIIKENIPFKLTRERTEYAKACLPVYENYYPEILAEIRGLADGQQEDQEIFTAILFSMYAIAPVCRCSSFAFADDNEVLLGRNSDFLTELEKLNMNAIYRLSGAYAFTGNTTAFIEMEDGVNEHGLAIGLTSVASAYVRPGFNAGLLLRFLLEKCRTVREALELLNEVPVGSAFTLTMADKEGNIAAAEGNAEKKSVLIPPCGGRRAVYAANIFNIEEMKRYNVKGIDTWNAEERLQTLSNAFEKESIPYDVETAKELLSGRRGFLCQYDRSTGRDTVWSVVYDLKRGGILRAEGNPQRKSFREDLRFPDINKKNASHLKETGI